jgi:carbon-monoxide dehydrogenase medium subunit
VALPSEFRYYRPDTLEETLRMMEELGVQKKVLVGGTDLMSGVRSGKITLPENIIDVTRVKELTTVDDAGDIVRIGAAKKLSEIESSQIVRNKFPILAEAISTMGSFQIRNMGTIGGNLCNASPAADTAPPLLVLDANVEIASIKRNRTVHMNKFFLAPGKTVVDSNEIVTKIQIPASLSHDKWGFVKLGRRKAFTLSIISIAVLLKVQDNIFEDARIALGSVAPTPVRITKAETFLKGKSVSEGVIDEASLMVRDETKPISDVRASAEYRREMSYELTKNLLMKLSKG